MPKKRSALGTNGWRSNSKTCRRSSCLHDWLLCSSLNWEELNFTTHHILQFFILHIAKFRWNPKEARIAARNIATKRNVYSPLKACHEKKRRYSSISCFSMFFPKKPQLWTPSVQACENEVQALRASRRPPVPRDLAAERSQRAAAHEQGSQLCVSRKF